MKKKNGKRMALTINKRDMNMHCNTKILNFFFRSFLLSFSWIAMHDLYLPFSLCNLFCSSHIWQKWTISADSKHINTNIYPFRIRSSPKSTTTTTIMYQFQIKFAENWERQNKNVQETRHHVGSWWSDVCHSPFSICIHIWFTNRVLTLFEPIFRLRTQINTGNGFQNIKKKKKKNNENN